MKKLFLLFAVVAAMSAGITSCDKGPLCWEIEVKDSGGVFKTKDQFYGTADQADVYIKANWPDGKKKKTTKSQSDCESFQDWF